MAETIKCPSCGCSIEVTEVLTQQLRTQLRSEFALEWRNREAELTKEKQSLEAQRASLVKEKANIDLEIDRRTIALKKRLKVKAWRKAKEKLAAEVQATQSELAQAKAELQQAKNDELQLRKERQQLQEEQQNLELTLMRRLDAERENIQSAARQQVDNDHRLKVAEFEKRISDMSKELDDAKRIANQGSQQLQGEVLELDLEELLRQQFPLDEIKPVAKGIRGADVIQIVRDASLSECGAIIWESKRTTNWSNAWLPKLRDDQRAANACAAILVTEKLHPKMSAAFESIDGIWVTNRDCCIALATALRYGMLDVAEARAPCKGNMEKWNRYITTYRIRCLRIESRESSRHSSQCKATS